MGVGPNRTRTGRDTAESAAADGQLPVVGQGTPSKIRKSTHGTWRAAVLGGVHILILIHAIHFLVAGRTLSPVEPSESMYTLELGEVNAGFIFFVVALISTLILGRWVCGWACHVVAIQDLCGWIMKKLGVRPRPFRSRLLRWAPWLVALYMFVWPSLLRTAAPRVAAIDWGPLDPALTRIFAVAPGAFPGFSNHVITTGFWDTFPGPVFAVLTLVICGFAAVYALGAKGFCTYGCPYGAFFGGADRFAPGRILVNDHCEQSGHCTANCTSNVRVHEEIRAYGMVVDPGCMKCTDCISVCPNDALRFGFSLPAIVKGASGDKPKRRYDLTVPEELFAGAVFLATTWALRGLYDAVPLLMAVGLGGITAFAVLKLWWIARRPTVSLQNLVFKSGGSWRIAGRVFVMMTLLWMTFVAHSAFVQWHRDRGAHYLNLTQASRSEVLSGEALGRRYSPEHDTAVEESFRHFQTSDRWGLAGVPEVKLGLAWGHLLRDEADEAEKRIREALELVPRSPRQHQNLYEFLLARSRFVEARETLAAKIVLSDAPSAQDHFQLAGLLTLEERYDEALVHYLVCTEVEPDFGPAHYNAGGLLRRLGRLPEAVERLGAASELMPRDRDVHVELGLALAALGRTADAIAILERAIELDPESPESRQHLPALIQRLREDSTAPTTP